MCGIAGIYNFNGLKVDKGHLKAFTDSMIHRGPDGAGYELMNEGKLGLGHRRLSILDLSDAGKQPFYYKDRYCIVYNGEIFNFNDIRKILISKGYTFVSDTDTEVIMAAYDCYGLGCFDHFNGMWAFALWDEKEKSLILSRDRFGVKPLYYANVSLDNFAFASETRAFKFLNGFTRSINQANYAITIKNNYALEGLGYTIFNDIYQLLPGHYIEIKESQRPIRQKRWYDIRDNIKPVIGQPNERIDAFYNIFRDACRIRLISDVPVATALSGGLDSSSIYSTVNDILKTERNDRVNKDSQLAVSAIFPGLENDEKEYVEKAVDFTQGEIRWVTTDTSNLISDIERDTELFDAISNVPITAISSIYKGMKRAGITVSLDGHGADEMLYGYLYMVYDLWLDALSQQNNSKAGIYSEVLAGLYHPLNQKRQSDEFAMANRTFLSFKRRLKAFLKKVIGQPENNITHYLPLDLPSLSDKPYNFSNLGFDKRMLYYEFFQNSLPSLLRNFDRAGMMNSVEIRMPYLDYRVVEFVFSLPIENKIGAGFTKRVVRDAMKGKMNEEIRQRTFKVGIASPFHHWAEENLQSWLYLKVNSFQQDEKQKFLGLLDEFYSSKNIKNLEAVWQRINMDLIA
jgi:asparagine synthase (glutamine-hydrolysing)